MLRGRRTVRADGSPIYLAGRLAVFSFLTPMFGVILLSEPLSAAFIAAALLVGAGIVLVNRPA